MYAPSDHLSSFQKSPSKIFDEFIDSTMFAYEGMQCGISVEVLEDNEDGTVPG